MRAVLTLSRAVPNNTAKRITGSIPTTVKSRRLNTLRRPHTHEDRMDSATMYPPGMAVWRRVVTIRSGGGARPRGTQVKGSVPTLAWHTIVLSSHGKRQRDDTPKRTWYQRVIGNKRRYLSWHGHPDVLDLETLPVRPFAADLNQANPKRLHYRLHGGDALDARACLLPPALALAGDAAPRVACGHPHETTGIHRAEINGGGERTHRAKSPRKKMGGAGGGRAETGCENVGTVHLAPLLESHDGPPAMCLLGRMQQSTMCGAT